MRLRFIDRLLSLDACASATALKCVTFEEAMLARPSLARGVPKTLLVEWFGQLAALLVAESTEYQSLAVLGSFASCAFGAPLLAGEVAKLSITVRSWHEDSAFLDGLIQTETQDALIIQKAVIAFVPRQDLWDEEDLRAAVRAAKGIFPKPVGFR
jgi:3-hydroxymyristoyl/3-hydroxydecanoyl-(acyl carrier protein) dehydratase